MWWHPFLLLLTRDHLWSIARNPRSSWVLLVASRDGSKEMLFYLTTLHLARFLREDPMVVDESNTDTARRVAYDQWGQGDFLCQNDVL
ncbi:hypothetical protein ACS0TY_005873 [Phlomoides rotata]